MKSEFLIAVTQLAAERNLPREKVLEAIEMALVSAYKKDNQGASINVSVKLNPNTGELKIYALKAAVEPVEDPEKEMSLEEARRIKPEAQLGDVIEIETEPHLGRIGAQTAKQVVMQRLREAERELVFEEYAHREGEVVTGVVQRMEGRNVMMDLGRTEALVPPSEQVPSERYRPNQRLKVYILEVRRGSKGPEIIVSRTHKNLLRRLFEMEIPEIYNGVVEIMAIAREPGFRSKIAVAARQEGVDPVGSCVGVRGIRIQNIVNELQGEKIDVMPWSRDPAGFISNALSPAQVQRTELDQEEGTALVVVPDRQLSLAIGREGQNARLAARLTGWKIDIKSATEYEAERLQRTAVETEARREAGAEAVATPETEAEVAPTEEVLEEAPEAPVAPAAAAQIPEEAVAPAEEEVVEEAAAAPEVPSYEQIVEEVTLPQERGAVTSEEEEVPEEEEWEEEEEEEEEDIWAMPAGAKESASGIRFAEDIMPEWGRGRGKGRKRKSRGREGGRGKKGRRARVGSDRGQGG